MTKPESDVVVAQPLLGVDDDVLAGSVPTGSPSHLALDELVVPGEPDAQNTVGSMLGHLGGMSGMVAVEHPAPLHTGDHPGPTHLQRVRPDQGARLVRLAAGLWKR